MIHDISYRMKDFYDDSIIAQVPTVQEANYLCTRQQRAEYVTDLSSDDLLSKLRDKYPRYLFRLHSTAQGDHISVPGGMSVKAP